MDMIVLRSNKSVPSDTVPISSLSHGPGELSVTIVDLSPKDQFDVRRDPHIIGAAPPMPMQLIRALDAPAVTTSAVPAVSWGVQAVGAVGSAYSGGGVTVAVLDTGIDPAHKTLPGFSGVEIETKNFTNDPEGDLDGHGTHCAGTIFGRTTGGCRIGVAPGVGRAMIGKVLGQGGGSTETIFKAILWAYQNGAQVISMSLGIDFPGYQEKLSAILPQRLATSMALAAYRANVRLFDRLSQVTCARDGVVQGAVVVAAAGNESQRDTNPNYRITVAPPAAAELFLSVAALGQSKDGNQNPYVIAPFSNSGARLSAPGLNIWSAKLGGGLTAMSGTSMATPHVAGVAALWAEKLKRQGRPFRAAEVIGWIEQSVARLKYLDPDDVGIGLVQAP
jgi:subtilisin family serine protease